MSAPKLIIWAIKLIIWTTNRTFFSVTWSRFPSIHCSAGWRFSLCLRSTLHFRRRGRFERHAADLDSGSHYTTWALDGVPGYDQESIPYQ